MEVISNEVKYSSKFLNFIESKYRNTKGDINKWFWVERPNNRKAVVIACIIEKYEGNILGFIKSILHLKKTKYLAVTKEFRVPINDYEWGFPAGLIDDNEKPEDTIKRELEEETGLKVKNIDCITPILISSAGISNESIYIGYVKAEGTPNKDKLEASEDIETFLYSRKDINKLLKNKDIIFGKTAYGIMRSFAKFGDI